MQSSRTSRSLAIVQAERVFGIAADIDASVVVAWPSEESVEDAAAATRFADLCRVAEPFGVRVGLEFRGDSSSVKDLRTAWHIVEMAAMANGGILIDSFHFHVGGSVPEMMDPIPAEKIFLVQVSDIPDLPRRELQNRHRLYPGSGAADLEQLLAAVRAKGYSGYYSLELHNEAYWQEDPVVVATEGLRSMGRLDIV
jgi:2-keto-myo-inositol isomerase